MGALSPLPPPPPPPPAAHTQIWLAGMRDGGGCAPAPHSTRATSRARGRGSRPYTPLPWLHRCSRCLLLAATATAAAATSASHNSTSSTPGAWWHQPGSPHHNQQQAEVPWWVLAQMKLQTGGLEEQEGRASTGSTPTPCSKPLDRRQQYPPDVRLLSVAADALCAPLPPLPTTARGSRRRVHARSGSVSAGDGIDMAALPRALGRAGFNRVLIVFKAAHTFAETGRALVQALARLGVRAQTSWVPDAYELSDAKWVGAFDDPSTFFIVLGSQLFTHLPQRYVLVQLEQLLGPQYIQAPLINALAVWDFSPSGAAFLRTALRHPRTAVITVPVPYDTATRVASPLPPAEAAAMDALNAQVAVAAAPLPPSAAAGGSGGGEASRAIGALFFGYVTPRRRALLSALQSAGVTVSFGYAFGSHAEALLSHSDVVLNLHQEDGVALEVHRLNALMLTGACIVSETSVDPVLDAAYASGVVFAHDGQLVEVVQELLADHRQRQRWRANALRLGRALQEDLSSLHEGMQLALDAAVAVEH